MLSKVDRLCRENKMPKAKLYNKAGITAAAVSQWRTGKTTPSEESIEKIASVLNVSVEYLLAEKEKSPSPLSIDLGDGETKTAPDDGSGMDDITKELIDFWETSNEDERRALMEMARLIKKQRG